MLVLLRKVNEKIMLGDPVEAEIKVLQIDGKQVRLGITAKMDIPIYREELKKNKKMLHKDGSHDQ